MTNEKIEKIIERVIEKAIENGWRGLKVDYLNIAVIDEFIIRQTYFSHDFAKALNFKLKDLGEWCDDGNDPLKFIEKLI